MNTTMTASKLRVILIILILGLMALTAVGFYFAQKQLTVYATEISALNASANSGNESLEELKSLQDSLDQERETVSKARSIVAESQQYLYQDQIVNSLSTIARKSGVVVTQIGFTPGDGSAATGGAAVPEVQTPTITTTPGATSSLKSETVNVTIESPVQYSKIMRFIQAIEQNGLKMQIASVSLTKGEGSTVTSQSFIIQVYVK